MLTSCYIVVNCYEEKNVIDYNCYKDYNLFRSEVYSFTVGRRSDRFDCYMLDFFIALAYSIYSFESDPYILTYYTI